MPKTACHSVVAAFLAVAVIIIALLAGYGPSYSYPEWYVSAHSTAHDMQLLIGLVHVFHVCSYMHGSIGFTVLNTTVYC